MRVLHVIDTLGVGGAEQMLVNLLPGLVREGHAVAVGVLRPPLTLARALEEKGVTVHQLPSHGKWNLLAGMRNVAHLAQRTDSQVVHAHLLFPTVYTGLARLFRVTSVHTCVTYHNLAYAPGCNKPGPGLVLRKLLNALSSRYGMDGRIAVSAAVARHYREQLRPGPVDVIPVPVSVAGIDSALQGMNGEQKKNTTTVRLVLPGRLVPEKGHGVLLDAMVRLRENKVDCTAVFAGDGPLRAELERMVSDLDLANRVTFAGLLPHAELLRAVASADIVVVPSLFEGFGTTAAEALAARRAVVATRAGGLVDIVEDGKTGILVDTGDVAALAEAIERLAFDPELRARLGEAGRARVLERFAVRRVAGQLADFYAQLVSRPV